MPTIPKEPQVYIPPTSDKVVAKKEEPQPFTAANHSTDGIPAGGATAFGATTQQLKRRLLLCQALFEQCAAASSDTASAPPHYLVPLFSSAIAKDTPNRDVLWFFSKGDGFVIQTAEACAKRKENEGTVFRRDPVGNYQVVRNGLKLQGHQLDAALEKLAITLDCGDLMALATKKHEAGTNSGLPKYSLAEVEQWLFNSNGTWDPSCQFPPSELGPREQTKYTPVQMITSLEPVGSGKYTSRIFVYAGGITDLQSPPPMRTAIGDSNNRDLLTGCDGGVAKAVINAAGAGLQAELYNKYGVPGVLGVPEYAKSRYAATEGRGYALTCDAHDMRDSHGAESIEFMTVPTRSLAGVRNMYREALEHSKDKDFLVLPLAGMTHPVLKGKPELSAEIATRELKSFIKENPASKLKVVFTIFQAPDIEKLYRKAAMHL